MTLLQDLIIFSLQLNQKGCLTNADMLLEVSDTGGFSNNAVTRSLPVNSAPTVTITAENLEENKKYYFRIVSMNDLGRDVTQTSLLGKFEAQSMW